MAKRSFEAHTYTPTAQADNAALTSSTYQNIEGNAATMYVEVMEIYEGGQATTSAVNIMQFARTSSNAATPTALASASATDGPMRSYSTALSSSAVTNVAATTGPFRTTSAAGGRLNLSFNAFGGVVRWVAAPGEEWGILSNTAGNGSVLSAYTGGNVGLMGSHIVYEVW
jgi:hypothetical protein